MTLLIVEGMPYQTSGQEKLVKRAAPLDVTSIKSDGTYIKITYSRPQKKGRIVFGDLVPFGKVWETGANETAELTCTRDIKVNNHRLKAGTYALFTIPEEDHWTIIFNRDPGQWGTYNYDPGKDALRFTVPVRHTETVYEPFTMEFADLDDQANLIMMWNKTKILIPISFVR